MFKPKIKSELTHDFLCERHVNLTKLNLVIKQDIFSVVSSYLDITPADLFIRLELNIDGDYELKCKVKSKRLKIVGFIK